MSDEQSPGNKASVVVDSQAIALAAAQGAAQAVAQFSTNLAQQQQQLAQANHTAILREMDRVTSDHRADLSRVETAVKEAVVGLTISMTAVNAKVDAHAASDTVQFGVHARLLYVGLGIILFAVFAVGAWQFIAKMMGS